MLIESSHSALAEEVAQRPRRAALPLHCLILFAMACLLAAICNSVSPRAIAWVEDWDSGVEARAWQSGIAVVDVTRTRELIDTGIMVLDARPLRDYDKGHLPGAISFPSSDAPQMLQELLPIMTKDAPLLVYCTSRACDEALMLCKFLQQQGFQDLRLFAGGCQAWEAAGLAAKGEAE